jgi:hypothetical protein
MKVLLALLAQHYSFTADNNTEWVHTIAKVPKVRHSTWHPGGGGH